ncbi:MAG TPA: hypothetical protein VEZ55_15625 [Chitinophagaceae bacterium]|nr:hypothetical protein [Chitinophagaceae bacterium]
MLQRHFLVLLTISTLPSTLLCQASNDSAARRVYQVYEAAMSPQILLYNGPEYVWTYPRSIGHPYFKSDSFLVGTVRYDDVTYFNVPLQYEAVQGEVIVKAPDLTKIVLNKNLISAFSVGDQYFVWISSSTGDLNQKGFYQVLLEGPTRLLAKRDKHLQRQFNPADPLIFKEANSFFIMSGDNSFLIRDEASLIDALAANKKQLKEFWRDNKLSFKRDAENLILKTVLFLHQVK